MKVVNASEAYRSVIDAAHPVNTKYSISFPSGYLQGRKEHQIGNNT
jgi:hypothetical protein